MSVYLRGDDLAYYGQQNADLASIMRASALIDGFLTRPEGMIYQNDAFGIPCSMESLSPSYTLYLTSALSPGTDVSATFSGPVNAAQPGDVLVFENDTPSNREACVVKEISGQTIKFISVKASHAIDEDCAAGLVLDQKKYMPDNRPLTRLAKTPLANVFGGVGRYGYGRRGDAANYNLEQFNILAALTKFGGPPVWEPFAQLNLGFDVQTGQVWVPAGILLSYYSEVRLFYVSGFTYETLPSAIKLACSTIMTALANRPGLGNIKSYKAGDTAITNFAATALDDDTRAQLTQFKARAFA